MRMPYPFELKDIVFFDDVKKKWVLPNDASKAQKKLFEEHKESLKTSKVLIVDDEGNPVELITS